MVTFLVIIIFILLFLWVGKRSRQERIVKCSKEEAERMYTSRMVRKVIFAIVYLVVFIYGISNASSHDFLSVIWGIVCSIFGGIMLIYCISGAISSFSKTEQLGKMDSKQYENFQNKTQSDMDKDDNGFKQARRANSAYKFGKWLGGQF